MLKQTRGLRNTKSSRFVTTLSNDLFHSPQFQNDMISWLIAKAKGPQRTVEDLTSRILFLGFGSIHSTSGVNTSFDFRNPVFIFCQAFSSALYHLCAYPEYVAPLREEIEQVVEQEGWTKIGVSKMYRLDSFLKEASRMVGQSTCKFHRVYARSYAHPYPRSCYPESAQRFHFFERHNNTCWSKCLRRDP